GRHRAPAPGPAPRTGAAGRHRAPAPQAGTVHRHRRPAPCTGTGASTAHRSRRPVPHAGTAGTTALFPGLPGTNTPRRAGLLVRPTGRTAVMAPPRVVLSGARGAPLLCGPA